MKKTLFLSLMLSIVAVGVQAQVASGGFRRAGTNAQIKAMHQKQLEDSLNLTDGQAKNVDAIQQDYMLKMRAVKLDTRMSDSARQSRLQDLQSERRAKLKEVMTEQQLAKMDNQKQRVKKVVRNKKNAVSKNTQSNSKNRVVKRIKTKKVRKHKHTIKH